MFDISVGRYDIQVTAGSTLPVSHTAQFLQHKEAFDSGLIDQQEALKHSTVYDMEGVLQRMDIIRHLKQTVEQQENLIKKQAGDLQTAEREVKHAKRQAELADFEAELSKLGSKARAAEALHEARLRDVEATVKDKQRSNQKDKK